MLIGDAGVGKTRLALEVLSRCRNAGRRCEWVAATRATAQVPLGVFSHRVPNPQDADVQPGRVFHQVVSELQRTSGQGPLLIGVDDAHELDEISAAVVHHLVSQEVAAVVATARAHLQLPEPLARLRTTGQLARHEVGNLGYDDTAEVLEHALEGQVALAAVRRLWDLSGGNPLYLRELVTGALATNALFRRDSVWRVHGDLVSGGLVDAVETRSVKLPRAARRVLATISFAEPVRLKALEALTTTRVLEQLEDAGWLAVESGGQGGLRARLAHPLYGEVMRASVPTVAAVKIQRQLADTLERVGLVDGEAVQFATWQMACGRKVDPAVAESGARQALEARDYRLAERLTGWFLGHDNDDAIRYLHGIALSAQGRVAEAEVVFGEMGETATDPHDRVRLAITTAMEQFWFGGRRLDAEHTLRWAETFKGTVSRELELSMMTARAGFQSFTAGADLTRASASAVLKAEHASDLQRLRVSISAAMAAAQAGRMEEAQSHIDTGLPLAAREAQFQPAGADLLLSTQTLVHRLSGRIDRARSQAAEGCQASIDGPLPSIAHPIWLLAYGQACTTGGDIAEAVRALREADDWLSEVDNSVWRPWVLANLAQALAMSGDHGQADQVLTQAHATYDKGLKSLACDLTLAEAWSMAARGELSRAAARCLDAATAAEGHGQHAYALLALSDAARLGAPQQAAESLANVAPRVEGDLAPMVVEMVSGFAHRDTEQLEGAAVSLEEAAALLHAAEAWSECRRIHRARGSRSPAAAAGVRAQALLAHCHRAATPAISRLKDQPWLTPREREVAGMAGHGLRNRTIAERLGVSLRTVENHLHMVYNKLGLAGRQDLVPLASYLGASPATSSWDPEPDRSEGLRSAD